MGTFIALVPEIRDRVKIIYETTRMPPHPVVVHPRVPTEVAEKIRQSFPDMSASAEGRELLAQIPIREAVPARSADYQELRDLRLEDFYFETGENWTWRGLPVLGCHMHKFYNLSVRQRVPAVTMGFTLVCLTLFELIWVPRVTKVLVEAETREVHRQVDILVDSLIPFTLSNQNAAIYETLDSIADRYDNWLKIVLVRADSCQICPLWPVEDVAGPSVITSMRTVDLWRDLGTGLAIGRPQRTDCGPALGTWAPGKGRHGVFPGVDRGRRAVPG